MPEMAARVSEFSELIVNYTADFVGRRWLATQVDGLLEDADCRLLVITGGPGVGKTAFMARLAADHPDWPRYFIRRDSRDLLQPGDANTFLLTVGGQLASFYPQLYKPENLEIVVRQRIGEVSVGAEVIGARIAELRASPFYQLGLQVEQDFARVAGRAAGIEIGRLVTDPRLLPMHDLLYMGLLDPARLLSQTDPAQRIVILIDALDEVRYSPAEQDIVEMLQKLPEMPGNLRFVISSRPDSSLRLLLKRRDARELAMDVGGENNRGDLREYVEINLTAKPVEEALASVGSDKSGFSDRLLAKAAGNFLYVKSVLQAIHTDADNPDRLRQLLQVEDLPENLTALYDHFLASIVDRANHGFGDAAWRSYLKPLLGALAVAQQPLSEKQIAAFTGLKPGDVHDLLRELRQFVENLDGPAGTHRIYHTSFAEFLLDREANHDYWIDGQEMHGGVADRILVAYGHDWQSCEDYGQNYLATHLFESGNVERLRTLIDEDWLQARYQHDNFSYGGFLTDVELVWRATAAVDQRQIGSGQAAIYLADEIRSALCFASVGSLASNAPPSLFAGLVTNRVWTPQQGLVFARRVPDAASRYEALTTLAPHLPEPLQAEALSDAIAAAGRIGDDQRSVQIVTEILPELPSALRANALGCAVDAIGRLSDERRELKMLNYLAWTTVQTGIRSKAIGDLAETLAQMSGRRADSLAETVEALTRIDDVVARDVALTELAAELALPPEKLQTTSESLPEDGDSATGDESSPQPPAELLAQITTSDENLRAWAMAGYAPYVPESAVADANADVLGLGLSAFLPELPEWGADSVLAKSLTELASELPEALMPEALERVRAMQSSYRGGALAALAPHLPQALVAVALAIASNFSGGRERGAALAALAPRLPDALLHQALSSIAEMELPAERGLALLKLSPHLPDDLMDDVAGILLMIAAPMPGGLDSRETTDLLIALAPRLPQASLADALAMAVDTKEEYARSAAIAALAPRLTDPLLPTALEAVRGFANDNCRIGPLIALAPRLSQELLPEALAIARGFQRASERIRALAGIAPRLPEPERTNVVGEACTAMEAVRYWSEEEAVDALTALAPRLSDARRDEVLRKALELASKVTHPRGYREWTAIRRYPLLVKVIPQLQGQQRLEVESQALDELMDVPGHGNNESQWKAMFAQLASVLSSESFRKAEKVDKDGVMLAELDDAQLPDALAVAKAAKNEKWLLALLPRLPMSFLIEALSAAQEIGGDLLRARLLSEFAQQFACLAPQELYAAWQTTLRGMAGLKRRDFLRRLRLMAPIVAALGGERAAEGVVRAIRETGRWWP